MAHPSVEARLRVALVHLILTVISSEAGATGALEAVNPISAGASIKTGATVDKTEDWLRTDNTVTFIQCKSSHRLTSRYSLVCWSHRRGQ